MTDSQDSNLKPLTAQDLTKLQLDLLKEMEKGDYHSPSMGVVYVCRHLVDKKLATQHNEPFKVVFRITQAGRDLLTPPKVKLTKPQRDALKACANEFYVHKPFQKRNLIRADVLKRLQTAGLIMETGNVGLTYIYQATPAGIAALGGVE